jgi:hypothetical protein
MMFGTAATKKADNHSRGRGQRFLSQWRKHPHPPKLRLGLSAPLAIRLGVKRINAFSNHTNELRLSPNEYQTLY